MTDTTVMISPRFEEDVIELGNNTFKRKVLPKGTITYKGQKVTFNDKFLDNVVTSFKANPFDQTSFMLADSDNKHTLDPKQWGGEVTGLEKQADGLWAYFNLANDAAELIRKNKKMGVSCGIKVNYADAKSGKVYPAALHHVLGTLDAKVTGMGEWQEVTLSNEGEILQDLSDTKWVTTTPPVRKPGTKVQPTQQQLDDAAYAIALSLANDDEGGDNVDDAKDKGVTQAGPDLTLANERIGALEIELANARFDREAKDLIDAGVPPALIKLAEPVLRLPQPPVIELANNEDNVEVAEVIRAILNESKGLLKLANEQGNSGDGGDPDEQYEAKILKQWKVG